MAKLQVIINPSVFGKVDPREKGEKTRGKPSFLGRTSRTKSKEERQNLNR